MTCLIVSIGHGDPPMIPVYRVERSNVLKFGRLSMSINIVGTPYNEVHLYKNNIEACNIGFKHRVSCITVHQVPSDMLTTEGNPEDLLPFQRDLVNDVNVLQI